MRSHVRPLQAHPQLEISRRQLSESAEDVVVEYRVYNFRKQRDGTIVRGDGLSWSDLAWIAGLVLTWRQTGLSAEAWEASGQQSLNVTLLIWAISALLLVCRKARSVLHESVIALPKLGVQLQTTRGISLALPFLSSSNSYRFQIPLSTSKTFIPLEQISTIIINEGLRRWRVEYYLAIIKRSGSGIHVGFSHIRPPVAVLREVYHGLRETLFDEFDED